MARRNTRWIPDLREWTHTVVEHIPKRSRCGARLRWRWILHGEGDVFVERAATIVRALAPQVLTLVDIVDSIALQSCAWPDCRTAQRRGLGSESGSAGHHRSGRHFRRGSVAEHCRQEPSRRCNDAGAVAKWFSDKNPLQGGALAGKGTVQRHRRID